MKWQEIKLAAKTIPLNKTSPLETKYLVPLKPLVIYDIYVHEGYTNGKEKELHKCKLQPQEEKAGWICPGTILQTYFTNNNAILNYVFTLTITF